MNTQKEQCPKCGAEEGHLGFLLCGSRRSDVDFDQSGACRDRQIASLESSLARKDALIKDAKQSFDSIRQIAASSDGGQIIMEGRRQMIGDLARRASKLLEAKPN